MKKIVHIIDNLKIGGAETLLVGTIKKLPQFEHHVILLTEIIDFPEIETHATIYCIKHNHWGNLARSCMQVRQIVQNINPAVVHAHLFLAAFISRLALKNYPSLFYSLHSVTSKTVFKRIHLRWMERLIYNNRHKLLAVSKFVLKDYQRTIRRCSQGIVLYNFIADVYFDQNSSSKINGTLKRWVAVGTLKEVKNYEETISFFKALYDSEVEKDGLCLDIFGDGPLREKLKSQINALGLPIRLMGNERNIHSMLEGYDAYISLSTCEGYGLAPMEALAKGLPLFLSDIPVYREIYEGYASFIPLGPEGKAEFINAVQKTGDLSNKARKELQQNGKAYAFSMASSDAYIANLLKIYFN